MTQFTALTQDAKTIVVKFFDRQKKNCIFCESNKQLMVSLYAMMPEADPKVIGILKQYIVSLSDYLQESEIDLLKSEYPAVVKFCYDNKYYAGVFDRSGNEPYVPQSLIDLCMSIAEPKSGSSVFVPYSGDGSFAYAVADCFVEGFEKDEHSWAFSQILLHSQKAQASILLDDDKIPEGKLYEYIFSFPPMASNLKNKQIIDTFYELITQHLADDGELYCILPISFCYSTYWLNIRKILQDYHGIFSALVVTLPPILQPISSVSLCLLHIKKNHKDIVTLMNATGDEFSARRDVIGYKEHVLKVQSILETINSQDEKYVWDGSSSQLTEEANLQPSRYLIPQIIPQPKDGEKNIALSEILKIVPLTRRDEAFAQYSKIDKHCCPIIGLRELSSSYLNCDIQRDMLESSNEGVPRQILTTNCLLIGFIGGKFKVGRLHGVNQSSPVALREGIIPVLISSDAITEDYFLRCIMSEQAERQALMLSTGITISRLSKQDFFSIVITIPENKEQQYKLWEEDTRSSLTNADRKNIESYDEFRKDMHMKKHAIGQTLFNINNWWNLLKLARDKGNGIVDDRTELGSNRKVKVSDIYTNLEIALSKLSIQVSKFDTGYGLKKEKIPLTVFIEQYISEHKNPIFEYIYDKRLHHADSDLPEIDIDESSMTAIPTGKYILREGDPLEYVVFAPEALDIIFNNIISNACAHGFKDRQNNRNLIRIEIMSDGTDYIIAISNNGEPIKNVTPKEVLTYGITTDQTRTDDALKSHYGIGGYEIAKLMTEFDGDVEIVTTPEEEFTVTYRLIFHNTDILFGF